MVGAEGVGAEQRPKGAAGVDAWSEAKAGDWLREACAGWMEMTPRVRAKVNRADFNAFIMIPVLSMVQGSKVRNSCNPGIKEGRGKRNSRAGHDEKGNTGRSMDV